jgi:hypothetical protein
MKEIVYAFLLLIFSGSVLGQNLNSEQVSFDIKNKVLKRVTEIKSLPLSYDSLKNLNSFKLDSITVHDKKEGLEERAISELETGLTDRIKSDEMDPSFMSDGQFSPTGFSAEDLKLERIKEKSLQQDFPLTRKSFESAREDLEKKKKKYAEMADSRRKDIAKKRSSLSDKKVYERLETGFVASFNSMEFVPDQLHAQIGYYLDKNVAMGTGLVFSLRNPDSSDNHAISGLKLYSTIKLNSALFFLTEYHRQVRTPNETHQKNQLSSSNSFLTGIGSDIKLFKGLHLRTTISAFMDKNLTKPGPLYEKINLNAGLIYYRIK